MHYKLDRLPSSVNYYSQRLARTVCTPRRTMHRMTDLKSRAQGWVPDVSTFGARLALVRQRMGWTNIKEAADACAIPPQTWRQWESDKFVPRQLVNACMKIAGVTGVDYRWLALGPEASAVSPERVPERTTHGYQASHLDGQRVVAVGGEARPTSTVRTHVRKGMRTKPLER
jgi:transcriptional regulator with XRE-family HTH domain